MPIEINNNSIIRLVVRKGPDSERLNSTLATGELGYTTDTNRLFVGNGLQGNESPIGNKFHGVYSTAPTSDIQDGDLYFNSLAGILFARANNSWFSVSPASGSNIEYDGGGLRITAAFAGAGFTVAYGDGKLQFANNLLTVKSNTALTSALYVGPFSSVANYQSDSKITSQGPISVLDNNSTNRILLSATDKASTITLGGSGLLSSSDSLTFEIDDGTRKFEIKKGSTSGSFNQLTANPVFEFTGGLVRINSSLFVTGSTYSQEFVDTQRTVVSATSSFIVDISENNVPTLTALQVYNDSPVVGQALLTVGSHDYSILNARNTGNINFLGINTSISYQSSNVSISGNTYFKDGPITCSLPSTTFSVNAATIALTGNTTLKGDLSATGDIIAFSTSDQRLKENIEIIPNALEKILKLRGVEFDWTGSTIHTGHDVGLIAQEVQQQVPEAVGTRHDGYLGVHYEKIIPLLVEAIRELNSKIK